MLRLCLLVFVFTVPALARSRNHILFNVEEASPEEEVERRRLSNIRIPGDPEAHEGQLLKRETRDAYERSLQITLQSMDNSSPASSKSVGQSRLMMERKEVFDRSLLEFQSMETTTNSNADGRTERRRRRTLLQGHMNTKEKTRRMVDFVVAGFPTCGTTTLHRTLMDHAETSMLVEENCKFASGIASEAVAMQRLDDIATELATLTHDDNPWNPFEVDEGSPKKLGFHCSDSIFSHKSIARMQQHRRNSSNKAKFIIGVRHPVYMLQDMYNRRVVEIYERMLDESIPSFTDVLAMDKPWKGVSMDVTRYEVFLMQFAKTSMSSEQMNDLMGHDGYDIAVQPNDVEIFLYDMNQLHDDDKTRSALFRQDLSEFLDLGTALDPFVADAPIDPRTDTDIESYEETIDVCSSQFDDLRATLVRHGSYTAQWVVDEFLASGSVVAANMDHLIASVRTWGEDPCLRDGENKGRRTFVDMFNWDSSTY